jgi:hypothetical protein
MHKNKPPKARNPVVRGAIAAPKRNSGAHADKRRSALERALLTSINLYYLPKKG